MTSTCKCLRLRLSLSQLLTLNQNEFARSIQSIQPEEWLRIQKFVFKDDLLSSLAGRLLLRYAVVKLAGVPWSKVELARTDRGKPYVKQPEITFGLNVTHQGNFILLATSCTTEVGVDVMKIDRPRWCMSRYKTALEYIDFMAKQFSTTELNLMRTQSNDAQQLHMFYRLWCLKESVIKATGVGIHKDLSTLSFKVTDSLADSTEKVINSTKLESTEEGDGWCFDEQMIDSEHCAAVCYKSVSACRGGQSAFAEVTIAQLLKEAQTINLLPTCGVAEWEAFENRNIKPF